MSNFSLKFRIPENWVWEQLDSENATGILITHLPHIRWACGFTGSNGFLIIRGDGVHLFTDRRYETQAELEVCGVEIHIGKHDLIDYAKQTGIVDSSDRLIIQPEYITISELNHWKATVSGISQLSIENLLNKLIALKSGEEIAGMRKVQTVSDIVFKEILQYIQEGIRENELAAMIDYRHRMHGASGMAFDTIVAFGSNSALPHARPTDRKLCLGDSILLDFGCMVNGFSSDMTRTLCYGAPDAEFFDAYSSVQEAQENAFNITCAEVRASDVDYAARASLAEKGYGDFFSHSTGHGIGLEVHEWPRISENSDAVLLRGYTITIEPGIYLPGKFGIRIEDTVLIESHKCERLSSIDQDLILIGS